MSTPTTLQAQAQALSPDFILHHTTFVDISDDYLLMAQANDLTARGYAALLNPELGLGMDDLLIALTNDPHARDGRSRTIAALTANPETEKTVMTGKVRISLGPIRPISEDVPPLEVMTFVAPLAGWPHELGKLAFSHVAELSRFVLADSCRTLAMRKAGIPVWLTRHLFDRAAEAGKDRHAGVLYAIMPHYTAKLLLQGRVRMRQIASRFRTEDPVAARYFREFSIYFQHCSPKLYEFTDALTFVPPWHA